ncbi:hypothetical protein [Paenibacillus agilis]|uniref:Lon proteolytic domain-containing protein n=1 Tax=Paenibacillus agilis TaxID=3020863 RepID=A0A559IDS0_9BACL|nr:hypothetical protein [Paenibacillus agilis]TVX85603.1 hypothetical protein FPZ44_24935 [Paenibacillus agilis]
MRYKKVLILSAAVLLLVWLDILIPQQSRTYIGPGGIISVDEMLDSSMFTSKKVPSNFNIVYNKSYISSKKISDIINAIKGYELEAAQYEFDLSPEDQRKISRNILPYMKQEILHSVFSYLDMDVPRTLKSPVVILVPEMKEVSVFLEGDHLISIDEYPIDIVSDIPGALREKQIGEIIEVKLLREGETMILKSRLIPGSDGQPSIGIMLANNTPYTELDEDRIINVPNDMIGSSSGMILALGLVQQLQPDMMHLGDLKIVGTGSISSEGEVKKISGLNTKMKVAAESGADLFLYPYSMKEQVKNNSIGQMKLIAVKDLKDAIEKLQHERTDYMR